MVAVTQETNAMTMTCISAGMAGSSRSLPSWSCGFDSRRPLHELLVHRSLSAEQTASRDRARAVALIAAGYSAGAGVIAVVHSLAASTLGFLGRPGRM